MVAKTSKPLSNSEVSTSKGRQGEGTITLSDGTVVPYRPIQPADESALQRFHDQLSSESVRLRFMAVLPRLSEQQAHYFTHLDGHDRFALVALNADDPVEIIAVARYDRDPGTDCAEYAAVVADRWQGHGLGLALTRCLIDGACKRGIRSFYALVLPENLRMLNLLRDLGLPEHIRFEDQIERVQIELVESPSIKTGDSDDQFAGKHALEASRAARLPGTK
jgi:acetyltransferase